MALLPATFNRYARFLPVPRNSRANESEPLERPRSRSSAKRCFFNFWCFAPERSLVFKIFELSLLCDDVFFRFSLFRARAKLCFFDFLSFALGETLSRPFFRFPSWGKRYFFNFLLFGGAEEPFLSFSGFRHVPKTCFPDFHSVGIYRSSVFLIFSSSAPAEELFFRFSLRRWVPKRCFSIRNARMGGQGQSYSSWYN